MYFYLTLRNGDRVIAWTSSSRYPSFLATPLLTKKSQRVSRWRGHVMRIRAEVQCSSEKLHDHSRICLDVVKLCHRVVATRLEERFPCLVTSSTTTSNRLPSYLKIVLVTRTRYRFIGEINSWRYRSPCIGAFRKFWSQKVRGNFLHILILEI